MSRFIDVFIAFALFTDAATAGTPAPAEEIGGGMLGLAIAAGAIWMIRRSRSAGQR